jgi:hypothetical protein
LPTGANPTGTPPQDAAFDVVDTRRTLAAMFLRTLLDVHVHAAAFAEVERSDVDLTVDKLEREAMAGDQESRFARSGDCYPRPLNLIEIGPNRGPGGGSRGNRRHGEAPIRFRRLSDASTLPTNADDGEGLPKLVRL